MSFKLFSRLIGVILTAALLSCGTEPEEDPRIKQAKSLESECRSALAVGNYAQAVIAAKAAVQDTNLMSADSVATDQLRFCYTTSRTLNDLNEITKNLEAQIGAVLSMIGQDGGGLSLTPEGLHQLAADTKAGKYDPMVQSAIGLLLQAVIGPVQSLLEDNAGHLEAIIKNDRFKWNIVALPVKIADKQLLDAGGMYDMGEIHLIYGFTRTILGLMYTLQSIDYSISIGKLIEYVFNVKDENPVLKIMEYPGAGVMNAVAVLMATSPKFLRLDADKGAPLMNDAGAAFADGFDGILKAVKKMEKRKGDQADYVIEYREEDQKKYFVLHMAFKNLIPLIDASKFDGLTIPLNDNLLESLENMRNDFADVDGFNTNLQRDIFPIVALAAVVLINSGAFDALISLALENSDESTQNMVREALSLLGGNPDLLLGILVGLVEVEIEFDFGHMFANPVGLRDVFPAWVEPNMSSNATTYTQALTMATLVYSYECNDPATNPMMDGTYICSNGDPVDRGHFEKVVDMGTGTLYPLHTLGTLSEPYTHPDMQWTNESSQNFGLLWNDNAPTAADGINSILPSIGFKDPTFGGVLYLDVDVINGDNFIKTDGGSQPATLQSLNATIASLLSSVQGFLTQ